MSDRRGLDKRMLFMGKEEIDLQRGFKGYLYARYLYSLDMAKASYEAPLGCRQMIRQGNFWLSGASLPRTFGKRPAAKRWTLAPNPSSGNVPKFSLVVSTDQYNR